MSTALTTSADELLAISSAARVRGERCELVEGRVRTMSPAGWKHGKVVSRLHALLATYIEKHDLGESFGAETGFLIARDPDTVRAPDFAFIAKENLPEQEPTDAYWPGSPDLAIEVLSPNDTPEEVAAKTTAWLTSGVESLWNVDYVARTVTVCQPGAAPVVYEAGDELDAGELLMGLRLRVGRLFK